MSKTYTTVQGDRWDSVAYKQLGSCAYADALNAAFKEYSAAVLNKAERPSVLTKLHDLAQVIANLPDKVRHKEEERGL